MRLALLLVLTVSCGGTTPHTTEPVDRAVAQDPPADRGPDGSEPAAGRLPADVVPTHYALDLTIDPDADAYEGTCHIRARLENPRRVVWMHARDLEVLEATVAHGGDVHPAQLTAQEDDDGFARLELPTALEGEVELRFRYRAAFGRALGGIYKVEHQDHAYAFTQMEPLSARTAFPSFDEPRYKTPYDVTLRTKPEDVAIANAALEETTREDGLDVHRFATTAPIPSYLFALAVGPLDVVEGEAIPANEVRDEPLPFRGVAPHGRGEELAYTMEHTGAILAALEDYFGSPYPFDKLDVVAVPDFEAGAMENVGLVTFRDSILLVNEAETPARRMRFWAYIMAHELAHMWFGNLVTMDWWDDLWLNEAFASWMEHKAVAAWRPRYEPDVSLTDWVTSVMSEDALASARAIAQPIVSSHDIHNAFDGITYGKGAGVLAMFEQWMGEEVFQRAVRAYLEAHRSGNATRADLQSAMAEAAGRDIAGPFDSFLTQPGVPVVAAELRCEDDAAEVHLQQSRYVPIGSSAEGERTWSIPICVRYGRGRGRRAEVAEACGLLSEAEGSVTLEGSCPDWVHPNANAAGYYRWSLEGDALASLRRNLGALTTAERLSVADSLAAGFASGQIEGGDALEALLALAGDEHHSVATAPLELFDFVLANVTDEAHAASLRRRLSRAYAADYRRLGWAGRDGEEETARLRRGALVAFLANVVRDPRVRREGARRGVAYVGEDALDPEAVPSDLAEAAVAVAVQEGDEAFFDRVLARLGTTADGVVRRALLRGLGSTRDPELARRALDLSLTDDVRTNEVIQPILMQVRDPEMRAGAWAWVQENFDAIVARLPPAYAGYLPQLMSGACDTETADAVQAYFAERVQELPGGPRNLAAATEAIRLCAARADAQRESVHEWL